MTKAWRALFGFVLVGLTATVVTDSSRPHRIDNDQRAVAIATLPCETNLQATSSGFLVDDELVVTVAHAVFESQDFAVRDVSGLWHRASIEHLDLGRDLAVLRVKGLRATPARSGEAAVDDRVRMVEGAASGTAAGSITRRVNVRTNVVGSEETAVRAGYELALEIEPGDSGAAVVDDDGRLVAIVFARSTRREAVTWSTSVAEVGLVLGLGDIPEWQCDPAFEAELDLTPPEQEQLAG